MTPRHLRGKAGVSVSSMASALGMSDGSLRILEATPLQSWTLAQLGRYCAVLRHVIRITATDASGHETELT